MVVPGAAEAGPVLVTDRSVTIGVSEVSNVEVLSAVVGSLSAPFGATVTVLLNVPRADGAMVAITV